MVIWAAPGSFCSYNPVYEVLAGYLGGCESDSRDRRSGTHKRRVAIMTFDDVQTCGRLAFLPLPNGSILRYQPDDGTVRVLGYPYERAEKLDCLPILDTDIPAEGWMHRPTCPCGRCRHDGGDVE